MCKHTLMLLAGLLLSFVISCTQLPVAGVGSEVTNGTAAGVLYTLDGVPAKDAQVTLIPENYNTFTDARSQDLTKDTTDLNGNFRVSAKQAGRYTIECLSLKNRNRALITGIVLSDPSSMVSAKDTLRQPGSIIIRLPDSISTTNAYVYLPGTTIGRLLIDMVDAIRIDSVPPGIIPVVKYGVWGSLEEQTFATNVTVLSSDVSVILPFFKFSRRLFLNTMASGADVAGNVTGFPVLVRLNADNFSFAQAAANGQDLRVTKSDGTPLSLEIERYDSLAKRAELWVKIDTMYGNNSSQSIMLYWGASAHFGNYQNANTVFDTANGFTGVWHLTSANDATDNLYHGIAVNAVADSGAIGIGQHFDGLSSSITMPNTAASKLNFPENGVYSISAWVCADTMDGGWHTIVAKGHEQYYLKLTSLDKMEFVECQTSIGWQYTQSASPCGAKQWYLVTGVRNGNVQSLYVNGVLVNSLYSVRSGTVSRITTDDFTIGKYLRYSTSSNEGYAPFKGVIDEVRVENRVRSTDWIKLCYMNQKKADQLILYK